MIKSELHAQNDASTGQPKMPSKLGCSYGTHAEGRMKNKSSFRDPITLTVSVSDQTRFCLQANAEDWIFFYQQKGFFVQQRFFKSYIC